MSEEKKKVTPVKKKKPIKNLNVGINEFGELTSSVRFDDINAFLDANVKDRKLEEKKELEKAAKKKKKWVGYLDNVVKFVKKLKNGTSNIHRFR